MQNLEQLVGKISTIQRTSWTSLLRELWNTVAIVSLKWAAVRCLGARLGHPPGKPLHGKAVPTQEASNMGPPPLLSMNLQIESATCLLTLRLPAPGCQRKQTLRPLACEDLLRPLGPKHRFVCPQNGPAPVSVRYRCSSLSSSQYQSSV